MAKYHIFTDGSSRGNPGLGGWATVIMNAEETEILFTESDAEDYVTNNRMELKAMLCALQYAEDNPRDQFIIYSDSAYVVNSCNSWISNWATNGWRNSKKVIVENVDLMQALWSHLKRDFPNFDIRKCKGHDGEVGNEIADAIATKNWKKLGELIECWDITDRQHDIQEMNTDEYLAAGENWFPID